MMQQRVDDLALRKASPRRNARLGLRSPIVLVAPAVAVAALAAMPLIYLVIRASEAGPAFWQLIARPRTLQLLINTLLLAVSVSLASIAISVPLAWLLVRTNLPGRRFWSAVVVVPLAIPSLVGGYAFVAALGSGGIVPQWLARWGIAMPGIYGAPGAWLVLTLLSYPYVLLPVRASLQALDPAGEEAARSLGSSPLRVFWHVVMPALKPAVLSGGLLVALYTLSDFAAVSLLQFDSFTRAIYVQYQASFNRSYAAVLALVLVTLTAGILLLEAAVRGKKQYHRTGTGVRRQARPVDLGRWRWPAVVLISLLVMASVGMPVGVSSFWLLRGLFHGEAVSMEMGAALNSISVSLGAAVATVAGAIPVAILVVRYPSTTAKVLEKAAYLGYALPGIVVALALVFFGARYGGPLYQTVWMLLFAYVVLFLPQALGAVRSNLMLVSPNLENVARTLGYTPAQVLWRVTLPMIRPGVISGGALVFLTAMKELPATLLLGPIGFRSLTTVIWGAVSEAFYAKAAAPALVLIITSSLSLYFLLRKP